ncbi:phage tail protein [Pseudomonas sichuanensis]|uniref:phage tail protein n=1 Tax=Pseudomonas sichuanensis TaxID=2213015 RepID=UPI000DA65EAD|nr:phage tail protein [Pseudomonas sichuanensis]
MEKVGAYTERVTASGEWQGGDVQSGLRATPMKADYFNMLQRELLAVVQGAGIALDKTDDNQLLQAIRRIRGGAAANFGSWAWSESLNGNPGQGHLALNNANPTLATELRISETSADAEDFTQSLSLLRAGDTITFQDPSAVLSYRFRVTNSGVDNGAYRSVPVRHLSGGGGLPAADAVVSVLLTLAGASDDGLPVGSMIPMPKAGVPTGYLELDGSPHDGATFPDLYAYLGTTYNTGGEAPGFFRVPDSRGEFFRGWDHGRGIDAGRAIGSNQKGTAVAFDDAVTAGVAGWKANNAVDDKAETFSADTVPRTDYPLAATTVASAGVSATMTVGAARPRNIAVMWCIKAWSAPVNQANIDIGALAVQVSALGQRQRALGDGQTNQNLTANRLIGTTYVNTTGRTIWWEVSVSMSQGGTSTAYTGPAGALEPRSYVSNNGTGGSTDTHSVPVFHGESYYVSGGTLVRWHEARA